MFKTIKHKIRGFIAGFVVATVLWGIVVYPYMTFKITASNIPVDQQFALENSAQMAQLAKEAATPLPQKKPRQ